MQLFKAVLLLAVAALSVSAMPLTTQAPNPTQKKPTIPIPIEVACHAGSRQRLGLNLSLRSGLWNRDCSVFAPFDEGMRACPCT